MFLEIREPHTGKLLFKYDPERGLVEIVRKGRKTTVCLAEIKPDCEAVLLRPGLGLVNTEQLR